MMCGCVNGLGVEVVATSPDGPRVGPRDVDWFRVRVVGGMTREVSAYFLFVS